jgi:predicted phosphohydrolase
MIFQTKSSSYSVWAIADLHLSFGTPNKKMDVFGKEWLDWTEKIESNWRASINPQDLILIAGDISWAMHTHELESDLLWIDKLPGTKVMIRGNHDYWWKSRSKIEKILPKSIHIIQNDTFNWNGLSIGGARLWDTLEFNFGNYTLIPDQDSIFLQTSQETIKNNEKIFNRELARLEMSLKQLDPQANCRVVMTHYPPIGANLVSSRVSSLLEQYDVDICIFGHLHGINRAVPLFGEKNGIQYFLTACDYLDFKPLWIF